MEKPQAPMETFSALSLMEYIRLMTAAYLIKNDSQKSAKFKISAPDYEKMLAEPLHTPLLDLALNYDAAKALLEVFPQNDFISQYNNKIMKEVVLTFYENYKNRYINWLIIKDD